MIVCRTLLPDESVAVARSETVPPAGLVTVTVRR